MAKNDGGPAFPAITPPGENIYGTDVTSGMSLRDYFAAQAISGMMQGHPYRDGAGAGWQADMAWTAYSIASAMLATRSKGGDQ